LEVPLQIRLLTVAFVAVIFGGLVATTIQPVAAQLTVRRLSVTQATVDSKVVSGRFMFIRDSQSGGCWLAVANTGDTSIAAAPDQACQGT
jgi:hypothetical protein